MNTLTQILELFGNNIWLRTLNMSIFMFGSMILISLIHELGHVIMAMILNFELQEVNIGVGPSIKLGKIKLGAWLLSNYETFVKPKTPSNINQRYFLLLSAGIINQLLLELILIPHNNTYIFLFRIINMLLLFSNLIPISILGNDGYRLAQIVLST